MPGSDDQSRGCRTKIMNGMMNHDQRVSSHYNVCTTGKTQHISAAH